MGNCISPITPPHYLYDGSEGVPKDVTAVIVKDTVTKLRDRVFRGCTSLKSVIIPESVTALGDGVFNGCTSLALVTIPESLTALGNRVFKGCTSLASVTIPESVTALGDNLFEGCTSLESVTLLATVTVLDNRMFYNCTSLTSVTLSDVVTEIKSFTFYDLKSLESVVLPSSLKIIGNFVFAGCKSLHTINIPPSVTTLGDGVFARCISLSTIVVPDSIESLGYGVYGGCTNLTNYDEYLLEASKITIKDGPGAQLGFEGKLQREYGPEWCGISLEQIQEMKSHPQYNIDKYLMRHFVRDIVEPMTDGTSLSYALLKNRQSPLKAEVMVSHAWDESIRQFVEAIERSKEEGPFWVCAFSIHQNNDPAKGVTIGQQLGKDPEYGPFATILKEVDLMLAVLTDECDIYTRLWCVYEIYFAVGRHVKVRLAPHISADDLECGYTDKDICVNQALNRVNSKGALCGVPGTPMNEDEIAIRNVIETLGMGFKSVDEVVERIRLIHLVSYPMDEIINNKATALDKIRDAIEHILPCFAQDYELKNFDEFLSDKLLTHSGFERTRRDEGWAADHDYYITNGDEKHDVFQQWCLSILDMVSNSQA